MNRPLDVPLPRWFVVLFIALFTLGHHETTPDQKKSHDTASSRRWHFSFSHTRHCILRWINDHCTLALVIWRRILALPRRCCLKHLCKNGFSRGLTGVSSGVLCGFYGVLQQTEWPHSCALHICSENTHLACLCKQLLEMPWRAGSPRALCHGKCHAVRGQGVVDGGGAGTHLPILAVLHMHVYVHVHMPSSLAIPQFPVGLQ